MIRVILDVGAVTTLQVATLGACLRLGAEALGDFASRTRWRTGRGKRRAARQCRPGGGAKYCAAVTGILTALSALGGLVLTVVVIIMAED